MMPGEGEAKGDRRDPDAARGVLFDLDGVLVDTEGLKEASHRETLRELGFEGEIPDSFYHSMIGRSQTLVERLYLEEAGLAGRIDPETYHVRFRAAYTRRLRTEPTLVSGARPLLGRLRAEAWRLALVSASQRWMVEIVLERTGMGEDFGAVITAADVTHDKPDPEPYLRALDRLRLGPASAVVVEDTPTGLAAGLAAGLPVVAVRHAWNAPFDLSGATTVLTGLEDTEGVVRALAAALDSRSLEGAG